jgi:hypothetical protein
MADTSVVHIGENSPEQVAFKLFDLIRRGDPQHAGKTKKEMLDLYAECLNAVRMPHVRVKVG